MIVSVVHGLNKYASHIYETTKINEVISAMNKGHGMNSIIVISYYKYILMNITRVIYRNQNKRF
jgi:hypothetical protein